MSQPKFDDGILFNIDQYYVGLSFMFDGSVLYPICQIFPQIENKKVLPMGFMREAVHCHYCYARSFFIEHSEAGYTTEWKYRVFSPIEGIKDRFFEIDEKTLEIREIEVKLDEEKKGLTLVGGTDTEKNVVPIRKKPK